MPAKLTTIVLITLLGACSSTQTLTPIEESLSTHIRSDGSKEFVYTATMPSAAATRGNNVRGGARVKGGSSSNTRASAGITVGGSGRPQHGGGSGRSSVDEQLTARLEKTLKSHGYCRQGFMEQDRRYQQLDVTIHGECDETATDKDRQKFPNEE